MPTVPIVAPTMEEVASDELLGPSPALAPGTVVRLLRRRETAWLGLADASGAVVPAPPLPEDAPYTDWVAAWEGPLADAAWMLRQCNGVGRPLAVLAACACARRVERLVPSYAADLRGAMRLAESWARGEVTAGELAERGRPMQWAINAVRGGRQSVATLAAEAAWCAFYTATYNRDDYAFYASMAALSASAATPEAVTGPPYADDFTLLAQSSPIAATRRRSMARLVRRYISLGMVLSAAAARAP